MLDLMDLARDHRTTPREFLTKARESPNELTITDSFKPLRNRGKTTVERGASGGAGGDSGNSSPRSEAPSSHPTTLSSMNSGTFDNAGGASATTKDILMAARITPKMGEVLRAAREKAKAAAAAAAINFFDSGNSKETNLNPLHIFLGHAKGVTGKFIEEIDKLDGGCLTRLSSLNRTPLHHFMERNNKIDPYCLVAFYRADPQAFVRYDLHK
jgi:hypothetical protein